MTSLRTGNPICYVLRTSFESKSTYQEVDSSMIANAGSFLFRRKYIVVLLIWLFLFSALLSFLPHPVDLSHKYESVGMPTIAASETKDQKRFSQKNEILIYNAERKEKQGNLFEFPDMSITPVGCKVSCTITRDESLRNIADAFLFHLPRVSLPLPQRAHQDQLFLGVALESPAYYPWLNDPALMRVLNRTIGYPSSESASHTWVPLGPYAFHSENTNSYAVRFDFEPFFTKDNTAQNKTEFISWFGSNCNDKSHRLDFVTKLSKLVPLHSYGACLKNADLGPIPPGVVHNALDHHKLSILRKYVFDLALENSVCGDYVTEKIWQSLAAGAIPVYLGTSALDKFLPSRDCIIRVSDFGSVAAVADYLLQLWENPSLREKHLCRFDRESSFAKATPFGEILRASWHNHANTSLMCIICEGVRELQELADSGNSVTASPYPWCEQVSALP